MRSSPSRFSGAEVIQRALLRAGLSGCVGRGLPAQSSVGMAPQRPARGRLDAAQRQVVRRQAQWVARTHQPHCRMRSAESAAVAPLGAAFFVALSAAGCSHKEEVTPTRAPPSTVTAPAATSVTAQSPLASVSVAVPAPFKRSQLETVSVNTEPYCRKPPALGVGGAAADSTEANSPLACGRCKQISPKA
jgi:hypothetical protein